MEYGGLQSRPEVRGCRGEGSYGVTWECRVGWSYGVEGGVTELRVRSRGAEVRGHGIQHSV